MRAHSDKIPEWTKKRDRIISGIRKRVITDDRKNGRQLLEYFDSIGYPIEVAFQYVLNEMAYDSDKIIYSLKVTDYIAHKSHHTAVQEYLKVSSNKRQFDQRIGEVIDFLNTRKPAKMKSTSA